jgi:hypothetical protein
MIASVPSSGQLCAATGELTAAVYAVADNPSAVNRDAFFQAFVRNRVGARVPPELLANVPDGNYITTKDWQLRLPMVQLASGEPMLLMLTDIPWLRQSEPASAFVEFDGVEVLRIAMNNVVGVIVQVDGPRREAWAGISSNDVEPLLRGNF